MRHISIILNQRQKGTLPSDTVPNPRNDSHCMDITTRSWKTSFKELRPVVDEAKEEGVSESRVINDDAKKEEKSADSLIPSAVTEKGEKKEDTKVYIPIPRTPPPFPQRLKKKSKDGKFQRFMSLLKQMSVNIPLVEALEQMPGYAKYMKDLVTKKRTMRCESVNNLHHCSAIASYFLVQKKEDPGAFTIPCTIRSFNFAKALYDLGASINLMSLAVYKQLGLGDPRKTTMQLLMADRNVNISVGVLISVLVKVGKFIFPADFVILD